MALLKRPLERADRRDHNRLREDPMQGFDTVRHELDAKRQQLEEELQTAQGRVAEIQADLERVHEALEALIGPRKRSKSRARAGKKPAVSVQELQAHIARVRAEKPFASAHELQKAVRALVRESGGSLAGFPRSFAEALVSSPGFSGSGVDPSSLVSASRPANEAHSEPAAHEPPHSPASEAGEDSHDDEEEEDAGDTQAASSDEGPSTNLL
jgi:hypothetical protein